MAAPYSRAALIQKKDLKMRRLIEGGAYSRAALNRGFTVNVKGNIKSNMWMHFSSKLERRHVHKVDTQ